MPGSRAAALVRPRCAFRTRCHRSPVGGRPSNRRAPGRCSAGTLRLWRSHDQSEVLLAAPPPERLMTLASTPGRRNLWVRFAQSLRPPEMRGPRSSCHLGAGRRQRPAPVSPIGRGFSVTGEPMDPSLQPFTIDERAPGQFILSGELDMATAPRLNELTDVEGPLRLDLRGVSFMDSFGIAGLLRLYRRCERDGCSFLVESCSRPVERVLRIVGLYEIFTEDGR